MVNISWGTKIAALYASFVVLIIVMVVMSFNQKIDLVSDDYYDKEIAYQQKINEMNNANALSTKVAHSMANDGSLVLTFPEKFKNTEVQGEVYFFRPSDKSKDVKTPIQLNEHLQQKVAANALNRGMYKMQLSWKAANIPYYIEEIIVIP
jgi:hypothetical protein